MSEMSEQSELNIEARLAVEKLLKADENQLYVELGIRSQAIAKDFAVSSAFEPEVVYEEAEMGFIDDLKEFGKRIYRRLEQEMYNLFCKSTAEDEEDLKKFANAFNIGETEVAAVMTALLVTQFGMAPAVAPVIAALVIKRFFDPVYEEFCIFWGEKISEID
ncbi:hypothetical protein [Methanococcoides sp. AM1]|uniref:hypothetical protein n=1 Tax=Methanococcoides sp. AM1 TaxID=1201011 RepID=UPI001083D6C1|nr:hypothetical protein [Methanococcoides sp. AM1]